MDRRLLTNEFWISDGTKLTLNDSLVSCVTKKRLPYMDVPKSTVLLSRCRLMNVTSPTYVRVIAEHVGPKIPRIRACVEKTGGKWHSRTEAWQRTSRSRLFCGLFETRMCWLQSNLDTILLKEHVNKSRIIPRLEWPNKIRWRRSIHI